jgi:hypothetical protein
LLMKLWHLTADANNYNNLVPIKSLDWRKLEFNGVSLLNNWEPVAVRFIYERKEGDYPSLLPGIPVFSDKAVMVLYDLIKDSTEILPLRCRKGKYYAINVIEVINAINYEKSIVERFPSSGRIMMFDKYSFKHERVIGKHIFKISDEPKRRPFVSDEFRNRVISSGLTGFKFELVWDSVVD